MAYSVEKLALRSPTHTSAKLDLSDRSRIDDRDAFKGQRTPAKRRAKVLGEFFNRIGRQGEFTPKRSALSLHV